MIPVIKLMSIGENSKKLAKIILNRIAKKRSAEISPFLWRCCVTKAAKYPTAAPQKTVNIGFEKRMKKCFWSQEGLESLPLYFLHHK